MPRGTRVLPATGNASPQVGLPQRDGQLSAGPAVPDTESYAGADQGTLDLGPLMLLRAETSTCTLSCVVGHSYFSFLSPYTSGESSGTGDSIKWRHCFS